LLALHKPAFPGHYFRYLLVPRRGITNLRDLVVTILIGAKNGYENTVVASLAIRCGFSNQWSITLLTIEPTKVTRKRGNIVILDCLIRICAPGEGDEGNQNEGE